MYTFQDISLYASRHNNPAASQQDTVLFHQLVLDGEKRFDVCLKIPPIRPSALDVLLDGSAAFIFVLLSLDHIQVRRDDVLQHPASIEVDIFFSNWTSSFDAFLSSGARDNASAASCFFPGA